MATESSKHYSGNKRRAYNNDDIEHNQIKRRRINTMHRNLAFCNGKENVPFSFSYNDFITSKSTLNHSNHTSSSKSSHTPFQPPYNNSIKTGIQKLTEFWRKMVGYTDTKTVASPTITPTPIPIPIKKEKVPNYINFDNGTDHFDFQSLLKRLTKDHEESKEVHEFNVLAKQIEKMNINLSAEQMEEIMNDEKEMNEMIARMKGLDLSLDKEHNDEMIGILKRLSELTFDEEFDQVFDADEEFDVDDNNDTVQNIDNNTGQILHNQARKTIQTKKRKQKTIVHKCSEFMLSMLMIGAPLLYYYVH